MKFGISGKGHVYGWFLAAFLLLAALLLWRLFPGAGGDPDQKESGVEGDIPLTRATLQYYIWEDEEMYVREVVNAWNALQGREAVVLHVLSNSGHEEWLKTYDGSIQVDLVGLRGNSNVLELQQKGQLLGLGSYIQKSGLDVKAYGNMFNEITCDGEYYALPTRSTCWALYYNRNLFDRKGIAYPKGMTWEEYLALAEEMTWEDEDGTQIWGGYYPPWNYNMMAAQNGYYLLDDNLKPTEQCLAMLGRLYQSGSHVPYEEIKDRGDDCRYDFEEGNIAMIINGEWLANMLLEDAAAGKSVPEWDIAPLPVPDHANGKISVGQYQFAGISAFCEYPEEAFAFLEFLCGNPGAKIYAGNAVIPAYYSDEIREIYKEALSGKNTRVFFEAERIQEQPMWNGYNRLMEIYKTVAEDYLMGEIGLSEAMERFERERVILLEEPERMVYR